MFRQPAHCMGGEGGGRDGPEHSEGRNNMGARKWHMHCQMYLLYNACTKQHARKLQSIAIKNVSALLHVATSLTSLLHVFTKAYLHVVRCKACWVFPAWRYNDRQSSHKNLNTNSLHHRRVNKQRFQASHTQGIQGLRTRLCSPLVSGIASTVHASSFVTHSAVTHSSGSVACPAALPPCKGDLNCTGLVLVSQ